MKKSVLLDGLSSLFILLFLYTGISKVMSHRYFVLTMEKTPLRNYAELLAIAVPAVELVIGAALLIPLFIYRPRLRTWGLYGYTILMAIFTGYVWYMLKVWPSLPCTCGGIIQLMNWHQHLYFNAVFTILGVLAIWFNKRISSLQSNQTLALSGQ